MTSPRNITVAALPVAAAVGVFGVSLGVLATGAGIPGWHVVLMSATVFAGSAQFAAVAVIAGGGGTAAAVLSGVLLNSRYLAMGAAAAPELPRTRWRRALASQMVIDESYGLAVAQGVDGRPDGPTLVRSGALVWATWVSGTAVGAVSGPVIGDPTRLGLDAAFPALFLALLWPLLDGHPARRAAAVGAFVALVLGPFTPAGVPLAAAAVAVVAVSR